MPQLFTTSIPVDPPEPTSDGDTNPNPRPFEISCEQALKCLSTNCLSLSNKILELRQITQCHNPHILALTETWLTPDVYDGEIAIKGYKLLRSDSGRGRAGGVALYLRDSLPPAIVLPQPSLSTIDTLSVKICLTRLVTLVICVIYRSPISSSTDSLSLLTHLRALKSNCPFTHLLVTGDFNAPGIDWSKLSSRDGTFEKPLLSLVSESSWHQHVDSPTRYRTGQCPSLLDLVLTNEPHQVDTVHQLPPLGKSDHALLSFDFIIRWPSCKPAPRMVRSFKRTDFVRLNEFLTAQLSEFTRRGEVDTFNTHLEQCIIAADDKFVPRIRLPANNRPPLPRSIRHLLDNRSRLFARYKNTGLETDFANFKSIRNLCKEKIREFFTQQQRGILARARQSPSSLFKLLRHKRQASPSAFALNLPDGSPVTSPSQVAELFRNHFEQALNFPPVTSHPNLDVRTDIPTLNHFQVSLTEVETRLSSLDPYSSMGPDEIHPRILKEAAHTLAPFYTELFQICLDQGSYPESWKKGIISPIFKKGDRHLPSSYRPISLTCISSKVFERLIKDTILSHLRRNGLLSSFQHGFLPGRSCITNMLSVMDSLTQAYDDGHISHAIFIDFAKAFDRVPHLPLLHKLESYGISGNLLSLIRGFLSDRSFSVRTGPSLSSSSPMSSGVPQGSVLGPLLFLIYINDLPNIISVNTAMYADDVTIWGTSATAVQSAMDAAKKWSLDWSLPINDDKCVSMSFGGSSAHTFRASNSLPIPSAKQHKVLGFWLSDTLSFSHHTQKASKLGFRILNFLKRAFPRIEKADFHILYGTYIRPLLEYGSQIVHTGFIKDRDLLERVQRRATKCVFGLTHLPYETRMSSLNLYPLETRRIRGDLFLLYNLFATNEIEQFFTISSLDNLRGHSKKLFKPRTRTRVRQNFFTQRVIQIWNNLPQEVVDAPSKGIFKRKLDIFLGLNSSATQVTV